MARTFRIWGSLDNVQKSHIGYIINVNLRLENNNERLAVKLDGKNRRRKEELANHGLSLKSKVGIRNDVGRADKGLAHLRVYYLQLPRT